jgi:hypothetical protein
MQGRKITNLGKGRGGYANSTLQLAMQSSKFNLILNFTCVNSHEYNLVGLLFHKVS